MRVAEQIEIGAPASLVWAQVSDPSRALHFMAGITRWEVAGPARTGLGARYRMLLRVGSAEVGGLIEIVEDTPERDLAWNSVTGVDQRGRWRIREREGGSRVELRLQYGVAGSGVFGWVAEHLAARTVRG
ncbi:MAG TPA: SRPBCC family protein, partial [Candidatus Limnocylindria bacterium]|nr:SRPBCC family protein [Candidatus Limnocylindria bacterium]